jgi:hypothetical protein
MNVEIGAETSLFQEKEYINGIAVAVWVLFILYEYVRRRTLLCVMQEDPTVHVRKDMTLKYYASTIVICKIIQTLTGGRRFL